MPLPSRRIRIFVTLSLAFYLTGCGLSEYEANMASEQARIHRYDEENKYLDEPVEWPARKEEDKKGTGKKEADKNYVDVFFRPPIGISRKPNPKQHGMLYVFPRSGDKGNILSVEIGTSVNQADFANDVRKLFVPAGRDKSWEHSEKSVLGRMEPLVLDSTTFEDANTMYLINVYKKGNIQAAVVFHTDRTNNSEMTTKMALSLESLAVGADASQERREYSRFHTKAPGK